MEQATDAKILPSHNDFLTLDSTSLANRNSSQDSIAFSKGRGKHTHQHISHSNPPVFNECF